VPLIRVIQARDLVIMIDHHAPGIRLFDELARRPSSPTGEQTIFLDPCTAIVDYPRSEQALRFANIPAAILTGWRFACPASWSLAGVLHLNYLWAPTAPEMAARRRVDLCFLILIPLQWFLVGGFPLRRARKLWGKPGMLTTACTVVAAAFALIPTTDGLSGIPALVAAFGWLWWFGLLIWRTLRGGWRLGVRAVARLR